jgi:hypothetical protein
LTVVYGSDTAVFVVQSVTALATSSAEQLLGPLTEPALIDGADTVSAEVWLRVLGLELRDLVLETTVRLVPVDQDPWITYDAMVGLWGYGAVEGWEPLIDGGGIYLGEAVRLRVEQHHFRL